MRNYANRLNAIERRLKAQFCSCPVCHDRGAGPGVVVVHDGEEAPPKQTCPSCGKSALVNRVFLHTQPRRPIPRDLVEQPTETTPGTSDASAAPDGR